MLMGTIHGGGPQLISSQGKPQSIWFGGQVLTRRRAANAIPSSSRTEEVTEWEDDSTGESDTRATKEKLLSHECNEGIY